MYTFEVSVNGQRRVVAGAEDLDVLTAIVDLSGALGSATHLSPSRRERGMELGVSVGGMSRRAPVGQIEHRCWLERRLQIGDVVRIALVEQAQADPALRSVAQLTPVQQERADYERCKKMYHE